MAGKDLLDFDLPVVLPHSFQNIQRWSPGVRRRGGASSLTGIRPHVAIGGKTLSAREGTPPRVRRLEVVVADDVGRQVPRRGKDLPAVGDVASGGQVRPPALHLKNQG